MHRVELKAKSKSEKSVSLSLVPNAPCGVESLARFLHWEISFFVPNAPCGVESMELKADAVLKIYHSPQGSYSARYQNRNKKISKLQAPRSSKE